MTTFDPYASSRETTEGTVYSVTGGDWNELISEIGSQKDEKIVVNMGPQHPSTHGVLRLVLELEGETVSEIRCGIGYLHTGIEKNTEFRTWTQATTFVTRMDYLSPIQPDKKSCDIDFDVVLPLMIIPPPLTKESISVFELASINELFALIVANELLDPPPLEM